jgi:Fur family ferric uptake transcriptional regulator
MKNYTRYALKKLKEAGFKNTSQRETIVKLLAKTNKALSPYDMRDTLKKQKIGADVVTIYRVLETLEKLSLVHKVLAVNGYIRCNTDDIGKANEFCHHYLFCENCRKIDEIKGEDLSKLENRIRKDKHFKIKSHYLEFTGLCKDCLRKAKK